MPKFTFELTFNHATDVTIEANTQEEAEEILANSPELWNTKGYGEWDSELTHVDGEPVPAGYIGGGIFAMNDPELGPCDDFDHPHFKPGTHVRVVVGAGLDAGRTGVVVDWRNCGQFQLRHLPGHYTWFDYNTECLVKDEDGNVFRMFANYLEETDG